MATTSNNSHHSPLHSRSLTGNKYTSGRVVIDAGSQKFPGAAVLAVGGARRGGAGYINYITRDQLPSELVAHAYPDVVPLASGELGHLDTSDAIVVGPGAPAIASLPRARRIVVDGGALSYVHSAFTSEIAVLTPHEGELRSMGVDPTDRVSAAITAATRWNCILVLKGYRSIVATPGGVVHIDELGGPELSTAGTGDVLAGFLGSMLAAHKPDTLDSSAQVVIGALTLFSRAAQSSIKKRAPLVATDLLDEIPRLLAQGETFL